MISTLCLIFYIILTPTKFAIIEIYCFFIFFHGHKDSILPNIFSTHKAHSLIFVLSIVVIISILQGVL